MELALGVLRWAPETFRRSTPHELFAGLEGYNISHGGESHREKVKKQKEFQKFYEAVKATDGH